MEGDPVNGLLICRPHQSWEMSTAILCERGESLGVTFHGNHSFMLSSDAVRKLHLGHYTYYSKSVVVDEKREMLLEDCFCTSYVGGENTRCFRNGDSPDSVQGYLGWRNQAEVDHTTPSLVVIKNPRFPPGKSPDTTHVNLAEVLGLDIEQANQERWEKDFVDDNFDCFRGCLKVRTKDEAQNGASFKEVNAPTGHWKSVYNGVRKHRTARTGAFIKPHPC